MKDLSVIEKHLKGLCRDKAGLPGQAAKSSGADAENLPGQKEILPQREK